jgi:hypothetical protein
MSFHKWPGMMLLIGMVYTAGISVAQTDVPVEGLVLDRKTQKPVPNAKIRYGVDVQGQGEYGTTSDANGVFKLSMVSIAKLRIFVLNVDVQADGYVRKQEQIFTDPSGRPKIRIELEMAVPVIQESVSLRNADRIMEIDTALRAEFGDKVSFHVIGKGSIQIIATEENINKAKALIASCDVPLRQIWIQILIIQAGGKSKSDIPDDPEFKTVRDKLKSLFKFQSYQVIGRAEINGQEDMPFSFLQDPEQPGKASFSVSAGRLEYDKSSIRLRDLSISVRKPIRSEIRTTVNVPLGDTIVLGASKGETQDMALIAVVKVNAVK